MAGGFLIPQLAAQYQPSRGLAFSAVSLAIGALYLIGLARSWQRLGSRHAAEGAAGAPRPTRLDESAYG